jgi:phosphoglycerate dehydrogenase-like enzyme
VTSLHRGLARERPCLERLNLGFAMEGEIKVAILDDYQNVALKMADWSFVASRAELTVFNDHVADPEAVIERLMPFDVICVMRERTPLQRQIIERLRRLKLIVSTAQRNASIDMAAAEKRGIRVTGTGYRSTPTIEMTWALILASARHIVLESNSVRQDGSQFSTGRELGARTLGVLGLGNVGARVPRIGLAFGMKVIAWSQNMTAELAKAAGATLVAREELFREADVVTIHLVLSARTRGLVGAAELALMRPASWLVNTSPGPLSTKAHSSGHWNRVRLREPRSTFSASSPSRMITPFGVSTTCWPRRTSDMSRKTSIARSTAILPPPWPRGSTKWPTAIGRDRRPERLGGSGRAPLITPSMSNTTSDPAAHSASSDRRCCGRGQRRLSPEFQGRLSNRSRQLKFP